MDRFIQEAIIDRKGQRVLMFGFWTQVFEVARACKDKGVQVEWAPDSVISSGGGTKGFVFPDGWRELINEVFPFPIRENYGMSETTAISIGCREGHMHPVPWGIKHVVDPVTGKSKPRSGVQSGRLLVHDLLSTSLWPTTLTGDHVTIDWRGGCPCGRKGPFFLNNIYRLGEATGDDKITCAKTPQAYERLEEFALGLNS
jgi:phenylacetate-coenzyme A ligase PaaK-like adenylate-forming protein